MIISHILYLSSVWYSILSFNQFFIIKILPYWFVTKNFENHRIITFSLIFVLQKIWYFCKLWKIKKIRCFYVKGFYENVVFHAVYVVHFHAYRTKYHPIIVSCSKEFWFFNWLNNLEASCFILNLLLSHTTHLGKRMIFPSLFFDTLGLLLTVFFLHLKQYYRLIISIAFSLWTYWSVLSFRLCLSFCTIFLLCFFYFLCSLSLW